MAIKKSLSHPGPKPLAGGHGRRWRNFSASPPVTSQGEALHPPGKDAAIDWLRTLRAKGAQPLQPAHLRRRSMPARTPFLHLIALDVSGSMCQGGRLALAKGYAARLIEQAARKGEEVALLCFGGSGVQVLLRPGIARAAAIARVRPVGGGGGTPLASCLAEADRLLRVAMRRRGTATGGQTCLWLLSDGRTLEQPVAPSAAQDIIVVDFDDPQRAIGRCSAWAAQWRAEYRQPQFDC